MDLLSPHSDFYSILADWRAQEEETDEEAATEENMSDSEDEYHW
jgi:hypothetical protein